MLVLLVYECVFSIAVLQYCRGLDSWEQSLGRVQLASVPKSWGHYVYGPANHCFIGSSPKCSHLLALFFSPWNLELSEILKFQS